MPFKALEQSLNKESEHIKELFHKEKHGEISIDNQAKNELLEIEKILQEQIEKSRRYLSNTPVEDDLTLPEMVKMMEIMRERICEIEISATKQIRRKIIPSGGCVCKLKRNKVYISYTED